MSQAVAGQQGPDFELADAAGRPHRLREALKQRLLLLAFYKASCPTCQLMFPFLERIHRAYGDGGSVAVWGASQDDHDETEAFIREFGLGFPILIDEHPYMVSSAYALEFVPAVFLLDADGTILISDFGFSKATLTETASRLSRWTGRPAVQLFHADDGLPATRPG